MKVRVANILLALSALLLVVLLWECGSQYRALGHLYELQQEYRAYMQALKSLSEHPEGDTIIEGLDGVSSESLVHSFLILNRDPLYLRQAGVLFAQGQGLSKQVAMLYDGQEPKPKKKKARVKPKKVKRAIKKRKPSRVVVSRKRKKVKPMHLRDVNLIWPIRRSQFWLSSLFGRRRRPNGKMGFHYGIDLAALRGVPVMAATSGTVVQADYVPGYGKTILLKHNNKYKTRYAHLSRILVRKGQRVQQGRLIGKVGDTGYVRSSGKDASHLHFEVLVHGKHVNPLAVLGSL